MDGQTERCAHCGTPSTDGARFCVNCGAELGTEPTNPRVLPEATVTAERVYAVSGPLFADEVPGAPAQGRPAYASPLEPAYLADSPVEPRHGPGPGMWIGVVVVMVLALVLGGFLLFHSGGGADSAQPAQPIVPKEHRSASTPSSPDPSPSEASSSPLQVKGPPTNVAGFARASAPAHAPAGVDFAGQPVTYVAPNMVDGRNDTTWRTPGDATGMVLTFTLDQPTRLTRVGLVNGYSKIAYSRGRPYDWYHGNRRVLGVQWIFDDGSSVTQALGDSRTPQQVAIKPTTTSTVKLKITSVSRPGTGRAARNDTAISEVLLLGRTG